MCLGKSDFCQPYEAVCFEKVTDKPRGLAAVAEKSVAAAAEDEDGWRKGNVTYTGQK